MRPRDDLRTGSPPTPTGRMVQRMGARPGQAPRDADVIDPGSGSSPERHPATSMHPERSERLGTPPSQRCPDCLTPFAPEDVDRERGFAWCVPCRKAMHLSSTTSGPPASGPANLQKLEGGGLRVSWRTRRPMDVVSGTMSSTMGTVVLGAGLFILVTGNSGPLIAVPVFLTIGGVLLWQGLRALWRCVEVVRLRVEGRSVHIQDGPFSWQRQPPLDGALVRRLRLIREKVPFPDRGRDSFSPATMYTLMADMRDGSERVLVSGFMGRAEPLWLAFEFHRVLDLPALVELQA